MQIIDGKYHADQILAEIKSEVANLAAQGHEVTLAVVLVGENPASKIYVSNKMKRAEEVGIKTRLIHLQPSILEATLLDEIQKLNNDAHVDGIIVQLPLPVHIDRHKVQNAINPKKDVDGFNPINVGLLHSETLYSEASGGFVPCTPQGCMHLIKSVCNDLTGKIAVVIGRSGIVGRPMSALLLQENATVILCHSKTKNLEELTNKADIVVSAMGNPLSLKRNYFKEGAIVIDVGITRLEDGTIAGDVDFEDAIHAKLEAISPVPKGVGPMTIAYLLLNVLKAAKDVRLV